MNEIFLKNYTTFKIGGQPKSFFIAKNIDDIKAFFDRIGNEKYFILGGGSNLLVSENIKDYNVLKIELKNIDIKDNVIDVAAGEFFQTLIGDAIKNNLKGLEWGSGIPGTVGGAIFGNGGSFGGEIKDNVLDVLVYDIKAKKEKIFSKKDCNFEYRGSIFKENEGKYVILSARFELEKVDDNSAIKNIYKENLEKKKKTQPISEHSAGCVFKNIEYDSKNRELVDFLSGYDENEIFKEKKQISAAFLIDKLGLKGLEFNDAKISDVHANFIVNIGNAEYSDVKSLINIIKETIKSEVNVKLEEENEEI